MAKKHHKSVSSEGGCGSGANKSSEGESSSAEADSQLHESVSSDGGGCGSCGGGKLDESNDLVEDGFDIETHGGGSLESVDGFELSRAMTEGFTGEVVEIDEEMGAIPRSCDLEYETPESVCGRDDRVRIRSTSRLPWRMICKLIITRADGRKSGCTGWFIGPRTLITAGHCVYSHSAGGWAKSIEVVPGMDASNRPFGSQKSSAFRSVRGWTQDQKPEFDYGAIIMPDANLGNRVGWWGFAALSDSSLNNLLINNAGYAGDKPFGTSWYNAGRITQVTNRRLFYMIDTFGGNSGSPTWRYRNGKRHAIGIHNYGGCPNKSTRITQDVYDNMVAWKNV